MVLSILAILSMVALTKVGGVASAAKWEVSKRVVDDIAQAIRGDEIACDGVVRNGRHEIVATSFLSDVGRLPRAWPNPDPNGDPDDEERRLRTLTLAELFVQPSREWAGEDVLPFSYYPATTNYLRKKDWGLADSSVLVPCGWRGPYLKMTPGDSKWYLSDGWKEPFTAQLNEFARQSAFDKDVLECRARILPEDFDVWRTGRVQVADSVMSNGFEIAFIRHLGADHREDEIVPARDSSPGADFYGDTCVDLRTNTCAWIVVNVNPPSTITPDKYGFTLYGPKNGRIGAWEAYSTNSSLVRLESKGEIPIGRKVMRAWATYGGRTNKVMSAVKTVILPSSGYWTEIDIH